MQNLEHYGPQRPRRGLLLRLLAQTVPRDLDVTCNG